jgi:protein ImuA
MNKYDQWGKPMGNVQPALNRLRQSLAGIDPSLAPALPDRAREVGIGAGIDPVLGGGLSCGAFHELAPAGPIHLGAAIGFAMALAGLASRGRGETLWIATDFAACEAGAPYAPGLDRFGFDAGHLVMLRVPRPVDALWAMEEALRCGALSGVVAELTADGPDADLTATRRFALAAREAKGSTLGLLLRHRATPMPSAAATRWEIAAAASQPDRFGGLGAERFELVLTKNRRGPCGRWIVTWDHHDHVFHPAIPVGVAETALDRSDRAPLGRAG